MEPKRSSFNRILAVVLFVLYLITLAAFSYTNWAADPGFMQWWMTLLNTLILSIPLVLLYGSIYVLVVAWREHATVGQLNPRLAKIIHWAPRIAAILIIFFITLFSLDVFDGEASLLEMLGGFIIHSLPSIVMIILLLLSWKRPAIGFAAFLIAAALFAILFVRDIYALPNLLIFVLPLLLVAFLFLVDWKWVSAPAANAAA